MSKPNPVVEALERITIEASVIRVALPMTELEHGKHLQDIADIAEQALPLAQELVEKAEALEWVLNEFKHDGETYEYLLSGKDCPAIVKKMLGEKE